MIIMQILMDIKVKFLVSLIPKVGYEGSACDLAISIGGWVGGCEENQIY